MPASEAPSKVSFTIRRPTPVSRQGSSGPDTDGEGFRIPAIPKRLTESGRSRSGSPLANGKASPRTSRPPSRVTEPDSSDEEEEEVDEIVTGFDRFGVQRLNGKKKDEGPLVIPPLADRDWREVARKRKAAEIFVPGAGAARTGADGSVGGLGTADTINSGPQVAGLVKMEKTARMDVDKNGATVTQETMTTETIQVREETEDEKAVRALIAQAKGEVGSELSIAAIPSGDNDWTHPIDETEAYRRDVVTRPDSATLEDYERVPVEQFGAALLRGMGWKPGQAASRTRTGPVEPYLPAARPALLGIGAKEREVVDDGSKLKKSARPERRYIPVVKKEREGSGSAPSSRRASRSPGPDRRRDKGSERERNRDRHRDGDRDRDYDSDRRRDRDRDRDRDYDYERKERRKDRDYERELDKHRGRDDDDRRKEKYRDDRDRDRYR